MASFPNRRRASSVAGSSVKPSPSLIPWAGSLWLENSGTLRNHSLRETLLETYGHSPIQFGRIWWWTQASITASPRRLRNGRASQASPTCCPTGHGGTMENSRIAARPQIGGKPAAGRSVFVLQIITIAWMLVECGGSFVAARGNPRRSLRQTTRKMTIILGWMPGSPESRLWRSLCLGYSRSNRLTRG
jgi:hypothetical protein